MGGDALRGVFEQTNALFHISQGPCNASVLALCLGTFAEKEPLALCRNHELRVLRRRNTARLIYRSCWALSAEFRQSSREPEISIRFDQMDMVVCPFWAGKWTTASSTRRLPAASIQHCEEVRNDIRPSKRSCRTTAYQRSSAPAWVRAQRDVPSRSSCHLSVED